MGLAKGNARVLFLKNRTRIKSLPGFFVITHEIMGNLALKGSVSLPGNFSGSYKEVRGPGRICFIKTF
jgi:hypothetical protein